MAHVLRQLLLDKGHLQNEELENIETFTAFGAASFVEKVWRSGLVSDDVLIGLLRDECNVADGTDTLVNTPPSSGALGALSRELAEEHRAVPLAVDPAKITIGMLDPMNASGITAIKAYCFLPVEVEAVAPSTLFQALRDLYGIAPVRQESASIFRVGDGSAADAPAAEPPADADELSTDDDSRASIAPPPAEAVGDAAAAAPTLSIADDSGEGEPTDVTEEVQLPPPGTDEYADAVDVSLGSLSGEGAGEESAAAPAVDDPPASEPAAVPPVQAADDGPQAAEAASDPATADDAGSDDTGSNDDTGGDDDAAGEEEAGWQVSEPAAKTTPPMAADAADDDEPVADGEQGADGADTVTEAPSAEVAAADAANASDAAAMADAALPDDAAPSAGTDDDVAATDDVDASIPDGAPARITSAWGDAISDEDAADARTLDADAAAPEAAAAAAEDAAGDPDSAPPAADAPDAAPAAAAELQRVSDAGDLAPLADEFRSAILFAVDGQQARVSQATVDLADPAVAVDLSADGAFHRAFHLGNVAAGTRLAPSSSESAVFAAIHNAPPSTFAVFPVGAAQAPTALLYVDVDNGMLSDAQVGKARRLASELTAS